MARAFNVLCLIVMVIGCKTTSRTSHLKESWDSRNDPRLFSVDLFNYAELKKENFLKGQFGRPAWSDDYWPLNQAGAAKRWLNPHGDFKPIDLAGIGFIKLKKILKELMEYAAMPPASRGEMDDMKALNTLLEIYVFVLITPEHFKEKDLTLKKEDETRFKKAVKIFTDHKIAALYHAYNRYFENPTEEEQERLTKAAEAVKLRGFDYTGLFKQVGSLEFDFDATSKQEISKYIEKIKAKDSLDWSKRLGQAYAEKYDFVVGNKDYEFTTSELNMYVKNIINYEAMGISWGWMGHCHGWAPAAYLYEPPKHSVLVKKDGREAFFTEGDIRGLLSKAAADNSFDKSVQFMGTRCEEKEEDFPRNDQGRIIDAFLGGWNNDKFNHAVELRVHNTKEVYPKIGLKGLEDTEYEFIFSFEKINNNQLARAIDNEKKKLYWLKGWQSPYSSAGVLDVAIFSTQIGVNGLVPHIVIASNWPKEIGTEFDSNGNMLPYKNLTKAKELWQQALKEMGEPQEKDPTKYGNLKYYKKCRDVNAGAFHTTLVQLMSDGYTEANNTKATSFVMDKTRSDQVWNHPINSFVSYMGEKTPLKLENLIDPYLKWRAKGTESIVDVYTKLDYAIEVGTALAHYDKKDEAKAEVWYHYTLELDKNDMVIGGEWHGKLKNRGELMTNPKSGKALLENLVAIIKDKNPWSTTDSPDFLWRYLPGTRFVSGRYLNADILHKIHACSLQTGAYLKHKIKYLHKYNEKEIELTYTECSLDY